MKTPAGRREGLEVERPLSTDEAASLLGTVLLVRGRIEDVRHRTWLLPLALGCALIAGSEVDHPPALASVAPRCVAAGADAGACSAAAAGRAGSIVRLVPLWSPGSTVLFWVAAVALALLAMSTLAGHGRPQRLVFGAGLAVGASVVALGVDAAMRMSALVAPLANVAAIALAIATAVVAERSRGLAIVGAMFVAASVVLFHLVPEVVLPGGAVFPVISVIQMAGGVVLVASAFGLRRWPAVLPESVLPPFVRRFAAVPA